MNETPIFPMENHLFACYVADRYIFPLGIYFIIHCLWLMILVLSLLFACMSVLCVDWVGSDWLRREENIRRRKGII